MLGVLKSSLSQLALKLYELPERQVYEIISTMTKFKLIEPSLWLLSCFAVFCTEKFSLTFQGNILSKESMFPLLRLSAKMLPFFSYRRQYLLYISARGWVLHTQNTGGQNIQQIFVWIQNKHERDFLKWLLKSITKLQSLKSHISQLFIIYVPYYIKTTAWNEPFVALALYYLPTLNFL